MIGSDLRTDSDQLNDWAVELLEEIDVKNFLADNDYVFMMHQGYMFWYFKADGNPNPDVYFYHEGRSEPEKEYPLVEFLYNYPNRLSNETNKKKEWDKKVEFYKDLIDNYNWQQAPMLSLIDKFKEIGFWDKYFPSNSHEALGLSTVYDDVRFEKSTVFILYRPNDDTFEVTYLNPARDVIKIETHQNNIGTAEFKKIENWID
jgi:hypothetical protein